MNALPIIRQFGDHAVLLSWKEEISSSINDEVIQAAYYIQNRFSEVVKETVPAYQELAVYLSGNVAPKFFIGILQDHWNDIPEQPMIGKSQLITIPVCYEDDYQLDLPRVAQLNNISESEVIARHSRSCYKVYFLGFLPGFPYLGGLDPVLATPRLRTPRPRIASGSVAIGASQTGIYPIDSPGGWNVIGKTPLNVLAMHKEETFAFRQGDHVKFAPISSSEFLKIEKLDAAGEFQLEKEAYHG